MKAKINGFNALFKKTLILSAFAISSSITAFAQNGTYEKKANDGAYCAISFQRLGNQIKAEIFAWWNSTNAQTGYYNGAGTLKNNTAVLHSDENEPGCKVTVSVVQDKIRASFANCATDHLTDAFNGLYTKITDGIAGDYVVTTPKAYFYKTPDTSKTLKTYVLKGDKVTLDMDRIAASKNNWLYVYFTNKAGKETVGFLPMSQLKRIK
jgi:hypothetical protein